jgi:hypothetical protein
LGIPVFGEQAQVSRIDDDAMDLPNTRLGRDDPTPDGKLPSDRRADHNQRAAVLGSVKARPGNDGACG